MAYVNASYLCDVVGSVSDLEIRDYVVYSPTLGQVIILSAELYDALERQELQTVNSVKQLENVAYKAAMQIYKEHMKEEEKEYG